MNGLDFYIRVLKPWTRDPAFYKSVYTEQSDTPAHEGPTHHAAIELWTYSFPLDAPSEARLAGELRGIPPLLLQARGNLTGNARDLWMTGTGTMRQQVEGSRGSRPPHAAGGPGSEGRNPRGASRQRVSSPHWLEAQAPSKNGPSGIGKENYTWSLRNVHLVPMTWEDEVDSARARAGACACLAASRGASQPRAAALPVVANADEYQRRADAAVTQYMAFLRERRTS